MSKQSAQPPDPYKTAAAQTSTNIGTAIANRVMSAPNQTTPYGTLSEQIIGNYSYTDPNDGKNYQFPIFQQTQTLSPQEQSIKLQTDGARTNLATLANDRSAALLSALSGGIDFDNAPVRPDTSWLPQPEYNYYGNSPQFQRTVSDAGPITRTYGTDFSADRQRVEDALMGQLNTQIDRDMTREQTRLANQGIRIGSPAYDEAMRAFSQNTQQARTAAILGAGQEQSRLAGLEAQRAGFQNAAQGQAFNQNFAQAGFTNAADQQAFANIRDVTAANNQLKDRLVNFQKDQIGIQSSLRDAYLQEEALKRSQPVNEISALLGQTQVAPVNMNFRQMAGTNMPTTDVAGLINSNYQQQAQATNQANAQTGQIFGGILGGIGSLLASDKNVKENIKKVGKTNDGQNIYLYNMIGDKTPRMGLMAQEVAKKVPDAVGMLPMGIMGVDYEKALSNATRH